ncbi:MAG: hypothetical protein MI739_03335 [Bacteroidales bacterium]|nr:hypothetical protein [Bacteroidales bacterium]
MIHSKIQAQETDQEIKAIEIYLKKKSFFDLRKKPYRIKIGQRVMVPCKIASRKRKRLVVAELIKIEGKRMFFQPLSRRYEQTVYTIWTIDRIGFRTAFRVIETGLMEIYRIISMGDFSPNPRSTFKTVSIKSNKYGIRIVNDE